MRSPSRARSAISSCWGPLPAGREVGYIAIGAANGRGTYIGHFCTSVVE